MKFNWGTGIALFSACFMLMIMGFVVNSFQHKTELVADNYYQQEIGYQQRIDEQDNAKMLATKVGMSYQNGALQLAYPDTGWQGSIAFFRPSDSSLDFTVPIAIGESQLQQIDGKKLASGLWRLQFSWKMGDKPYYMEQSIVIP